MTIQGRRTYTVAAVALLGAFYLIATADGQVTYGSPSGDYSAIVQRIVAGVLLAQAAGYVALRLAISTLEQRVRDVAAAVAAHNKRK